MRIGSIAGSHRREAESARVARYLEREFESLGITDEHDAAIRGRTTYSLRVLVEYAKALRLVRESGVIDLTTFPYGM